MWPLYIAEIYGTAPAVTGYELVGQPLTYDWDDIGVLINPVSLKNHIFTAAVCFDRPPTSHVVEGLYGAVVNHDGLHLPERPGPVAGVAKRRKDGKKRAETLKTVDAD